MIRGLVRCNRCAGSGVEPGPSPSMDCARCGGRGAVMGEPITEYVPDGLIVVEAEEETLA